MIKNCLSYRYILIGFLLEFLIVPVRAWGGGWGNAGILVFVLYIITFIILNKNGANKQRSYKMVVSFLIPLFILNIIPRMVNWEGTISSLPEVSGHVFGILAGYLFSISNTRAYYKFGLILTLFIATILICTKGLDFWLHKQNYGTFTGKVSPYKAENFSATFENGDIRQFFPFYKQKTILLDFWYTGCGICFRKFPELQKIYNKYKEDSNVVIFAANQYVKRDSINQCFNMIRNRGYSFPVLMIKDSMVLRKYKIESFPTTIIINPKGEIVFRGDILQAAQVLSSVN